MVANGVRKPNKKIERLFWGKGIATNTKKIIEKHDLGKNKVRKPNKKNEKQILARITLCMGKNVKIILGLR